MSVAYPKILISGASGSLGKQLIYELVRRGVRPIALVRKSSNTEYVDSLSLEKRTADLCRDGQLEKLVEGVDAVIHTAAWVNFRRDSLAQFAEINTTAAAALFRAAQATGVKRFVHVSTVAALGAGLRVAGDSVRWGHQAALLDENCKFNLTHLRIPYIMTKHAADVELAELAKAGTTELVTVHPSIIVAPSRTGDDRGKAARMLSHLMMPDLLNRVNLVDIRDVAPGVIAALDKGRPGEKYLLTGDNISVRDLILAASSILGKSPHLVRLPRVVLNCTSRLAVFFARLLGRGKVSFYPDLVRLLDYDWTYSSMKARKELGYNYRSIHVTLDELLSNRFVGTWQMPVEP